MSCLLFVPEEALLLGYDKDKFIKLFCNCFIKAILS